MLVIKLMSVFNHYQSIYFEVSGGTLRCRLHLIIYMFYIVSTSYSIQASTPYYI